MIQLVPPTFMFTCKNIVFENNVEFENSESNLNQSLKILDIPN